jgi:cation diffusion facilitator family transporter
VSVGRRFEFPPEQWEDRARSRRLAWLSIVLLSSAGVLLFLTLGQSEAMKTAWMSDMLSIIPPVALLIALRYELREPTRRFPFGHTRSISIAFLVTAAMFSLLGLWLFFDAAMKLVHRERPPIGTMELFGRQFWAGWAMVAALAYSVGVGMLLGHLKRPVAKKLHDKMLDSDAEMNRAGWMSEGAAIIGILLVGFGHWWGDAAAAGVISLAIIRDGWINVRQVVADLMDESPTKMGTHELEELPRKLKNAAEELDWVEEAAVRLREQGHALTGDVFIVPKDNRDLVGRIERAADDLRRLDWRLNELVVMPVASLDDQTPPRLGETHRGHGGRRQR